ncbi:FKBP-type peptidyl-prolyl cis-trans isomerase N-terminal domain-containing protein [uncultured Fibrobacter sp.]|uniref:FKBP-type peptidyl-prolyl cis-trans isomerase N-terminal domain-containing protein n=1 Tax=uncultured Fibrobacter sp. TaxID=261512 RepID=UPI0025954B06|nr:FKBP-type peptidyl-prolyl cis-trans isomerase N-terminal domain-containing protein [uncultured Fibrobacter sp.]
MKFRTVALMASVATFVACNSTDKASVQIGPDAQDDVKTAYMLGSQFGNQLYMVETKQLEFTIDEPEFFSAVDEGYKMVTDSAFKIKYSDSIMVTIAQGMNSRAQSIMAANAPLPKKDSTDTTVSVKAPAKPDPMSAEQANRASYLLGVQFGSQFGSIKQQAAVEMNMAAFKQGLKDSRAKASDTTKQLQLSNDTLQAVSQRLREKILEQRKAMIEKQKEEEAKLREAIAPLRGDTLADGTQAKLNFKVKVTGVNLSAENLEAYSGRPLFVFYFSTTCGHCRHATPEIKEMAKQNLDKGIKTIAVASGGNNKRAIRAFIEEFKLDEAKIDVFFDESREFGELYSDGYVPKVYVVKADGSLMTFKNFESQKDSIKTELGKLATK